MAKDTLTITDNRTGKQYEIPIEDGGVIRAAQLRDIKTSADDFGLMSYDPAFTNTASCRSRITFIDGDQGILRYRGTNWKSGFGKRWGRVLWLSRMERLVSRG